MSDTIALSSEREVSVNWSSRRPLWPSLPLAQERRHSLTPGCTVRFSDRPQLIKHRVQALSASAKFTNADLPVLTAPSPDRAAAKTPPSQRIRKVATSGDLIVCTRKYLRRSRSRFSTLQPHDETEGSSRCFRALASTTELQSFGRLEKRP
jgi:hypothetical protein